MRIENCKLQISELNLQFAISHRGEGSPCTKSRLAFFWHQHQPYYPGRRRRRESHALGPLARDQGLLGHGDAAAGSAGDARHDQPRAQSAPAVGGLHRRRPPGHAPARLASAGRRTERGGRVLPAGQFLHGPSGPDDPAFSALPRVVQEARPRGRFGREGPQAIQQERPDRPAMLVEPGVDPSAGLRAGPPNWRSSATRGAAGPRRRSSGCWTSRWNCSARSCRCTGN